MKKIISFKTGKELHSYREICASTLEVIYKQATGSNWAELADKAIPELKKLNNIDFSMLQPKTVGSYSRTIVARQQDAEYPLSLVIFYFQLESKKVVLSHIYQNCDGNANDIIDYHDNHAPLEQNKNTIQTPIHDHKDRCLSFICQVDEGVSVTEHLFTKKNDDIRDKAVEKKESQNRSLFSANADDKTTNFIHQLEVCLGSKTGKESQQSRDK